MKRFFLYWGFAVAGVLSLAGCGGGDSGGSCPGLSGNAWVPSISSSVTASHDASVVVTKTDTHYTGPLIGLGQAAPASVEISVPVDMTTDLGAYGSVTLVANVSGMPAGIDGGAFPMLVSLSDGTNEYINLARSGSGNDCAAKGYYTCSGGTCSINSSCSISWPSAYFDRTHWEQHQAPNSFGTNSPSTNTFPTCNWAGGSTSVASNPACAFTSTFFPVSAPVRLRYGVTYTAKYVMIADSYASLSNRTATLNFSVIKKKDTTAAGAIDLNVVFVGNENINASRTDKGQQNLNTLITRVGEIFAQSNVGVKLGTVRGVEWTCDAGADRYAQLNVSDLGSMFANGGAQMAAGTEGKALNIYLVNGITDDTSSFGEGFTVLGFDGAIGGPPINSTAVSGVTVSTFGSLSSFNPNCSGSGICPVTSQEETFSQTAAVIAHELGHYFGLNHLSEYSGTEHDLLNDTPICTATENLSGTNLITIKTCLNTDNNIFTSTSKKCRDTCTAYSSSSGTFCPTAVECGFNYVMWWTSKNYKEGTANSDGNILSSQAGTVINYSPFVQ